MKSGFITFLFCIATLIAEAQNRGVAFEAVDFQTGLSKAVKSNKLLFVDFYTSWCGPCRQMAKEVFTKDYIGDYFTKHFVSLKIDAEKGEGVELAKKFQVNAYPTFIFFSKEGKEVFRIVGALPYDLFLSKVEKGLDPRRTPEKLRERYAGGERTPELVYDYMGLLFEERNETAGKEVADDYFNSLSVKKKMKPENFFLYNRYFLSDTIGNPRIQFLLENKKQFCKTVGKEKVEDLLQLWLGAALIRYVSDYHFQKDFFDKKEYEKLKIYVGKAALSDSLSVNSMIKIADARVEGNLPEFLDRCLSGFPDLKKGHRLITMINLNGLANVQDSTVRKKAVLLLKKYVPESEGANNRIITKIITELEKPGPYIFIAHINGAKSGMAVFNSFGKKGRADTVSFDNYKVIATLPGTDTLKMSVKIQSDEISYKNSRGVSVYPYMDFLIVPGETAELDITLERAKPPVVKWIDGGKISGDFVELNYVVLAPIGEEYKQLSIDNNIKGGDIREHTAYFLEVMKEEQEAIMDFVRTNTDSYVSALYLYDKYIWFDENEAEELFDKFPGSVRNSICGKAIKTKLMAGKPYRNGTFAPDFLKVAQNGRQVSLSQYKGKYVLLDFWGSWCGPCRASHPHLRELNKEYEPQGVVFINVAQENGQDLKKSRASWLAAVREDKLTWTQVLNNEGIEDCDLLKLFNVNAFPTKILIGPDGKIITRLIGANVDLESVLKRIFEK